MVWALGSEIPGSGKNLFRIPDPGVKKAPDPGSGSATLRTDNDNKNKFYWRQLQRGMNIVTYPRNSTCIRTEFSRSGS